MNAKCWRRSRTLIFNILVAVFAALADVTGVLQAAASPRTFAAVVIAVAVVNAVLRTMTRQPLTRKEK